MILKKLEETGFVTSLDFEELLDWKFSKVIVQQNPDLDAWMEYEKGKRISYIWNTSKYTRENSRNRALLLLQDNNIKFNHF